jgi:hypothetical protein
VDTCRIPCVKNVIVGSPLPCVTLPVALFAVPFVAGALRASNKFPRLEDMDISAALCCTRISAGILGACLSHGTSSRAARRFLAHRFGARRHVFAVLRGVTLLLANSNDIRYAQNCLLEF